MKNQKQTEKKDKNPMTLTAQEQLGKKVVDGLRKRTFGEPKIETPTGGKIFTFEHKNSIIKVSGLKSEGKTYPRYLITVTTDKKVDKHLRIPGKFARLAWKAVTEEPKAGKKPITQEETDKALKALEL